MSAEQAPLSVAEVGELGLLQRLQPFCDNWIGDDAAVLPGEDARSWVVTTDVLVDGVHFSDRTTGPTDVGWRAVAANLSDLAAMGATPVGITVGLSLPGTVAVSWVEAVYQGMTDCLTAYGGEILGGDICRSPQITLSITALGRVLPDQIICRHSAQPGQMIVATGYHGAARAGLELLLHPERGTGLAATDRAAFMGAHQRPRPRLDAVAVLRSVPETPRAIAGMDSSDGLANAVLQLCQASGVGARLVRSHLPVPPALPPWVGSETALHWTLYGGEDFELVLCLPPEVALACLSGFGPGAAIVGTTTATPTVELVETPTSQQGVVLDESRCFQHF